MQPILTIRGDKVGLGPIRHDLLETYQRWMNDFRVTRTLATPCRPFTREAEEQWVQQAATGQDVTFTIYELNGLRPIGNTGLHAIDNALGTCEFGMFIGEPELWGRGYATEVTSLMLGYAFDVLAMYNVMLFTYSINPAAIRAYEKAGFKRIGTRRNAMRVGRHRCDIIFMDAVPEDVERSFLDGVMRGSAGRGDGTASPGA